MEPFSQFLLFIFGLAEHYDLVFTAWSLLSLHHRGQCKVCLVKIPRNVYLCAICEENQKANGQGLSTIVLEFSFFQKSNL